MKMDLGMLSEELSRPTLEELFDTIKGYGFEAVCLSCATFTGEEIPAAGKLDAGEVKRAGELIKERGMYIPSFNGAINMIERDPGKLDADISTFEKIASLCPEIGCKIITLCTGSRNPYWKWFNHPFNATEEAWAKLKRTAKRLVAIAEEYDVVLGLEAEVTNVVSSSKKARCFLDEMDTPRIGVIMDISNLVNEGEATSEDIERITREAFYDVGYDVILAHGKDIKPSHVIDQTSCGNGLVDFDLMLALLKKYNYHGPMVIHHLLSEKEFPGCVEFMRNKIASN